MMSKLEEHKLMEKVTYAKDLPNDVMEDLAIMKGCEIPQYTPKTHIGIYVKNIIADTGNFWDLNSGLTFNCTHEDETNTYKIDICLKNGGVHVCLNGGVHVCLNETMYAESSKEGEQMMRDSFRSPDTKCKVFDFSWKKVLETRDAVDITVCIRCDDSYVGHQRCDLLRSTLEYYYENYPFYYFPEKHIHPNNFKSLADNIANDNEGIAIVITFSDNLIRLVEDYAKSYGGNYYEYDMINTYHDSTLILKKKHENKGDE